MKGRIKKYLVTAMCLVAFVLPMLQPMTVKAAETVGGANNEVVIDSITIDTTTSSTLKTINQFTLNAKNGYEIVGVLEPMRHGDDIHYYILALKVVKNGVIESISSTGVCDVVGYVACYKDGEITSSQSYSDANFSAIYFKSGTAQGINITASATGLKIFADSDSLKAYATTGDTSGMIDQPIDLDKDGILDKSIGYLQNLKRNFLNTGETDENGVGEISWSFSWDDTYPDYDDSYKVEVKADCTVGVKSMFGLGSEKTVKSDIRSVSECQYNELQVVVSLNDLKNIFNDFLSDNLPSGSDITSFGKTSSYKFTYYFRIYRYDETTGTYRYGKWVRMLSDGNVLDGNTSMTGTLGDFDENGDWIIDTDSTYGDGVETVTGSGKGDTIEDAIKDAEENRQDQLDFQASDLGDMTNWFISNIKNMINALGSFPSFIGSLFSFLPPQVLVFIGVALIAVVICRFLGR